jgi:hypothetical protein
MRDTVRRQGLHFSRAEPKKPLRCLVTSPGQGGPDPSETETRGGRNHHDDEQIIVSVSHDLAPKLDGAVLDFGNYNKMQRFLWLTMPAVKEPACACLRSTGAPAGKRSPCLDDQGPGLSDI